jgi:hypothetical protein
MEKPNNRNEQISRLYNQLRNSKELHLRYLKKLDQLNRIQSGQIELNERNSAELDGLEIAILNEVDNLIKSVNENYKETADRPNLAIIKIDKSKMPFFNYLLEKFNPNITLKECYIYKEKGQVDGVEFTLSLKDIISPITVIGLLNNRIKYINYVNNYSATLPIYISEHRKFQCHRIYQALDMLFQYHIMTLESKINELNISIQYLDDRIKELQ